MSRSACTRLDRVEERRRRGRDGRGCSTGEGPLGNVMVTSLVNARRTVDFTNVEYDDDGSRRGFDNQ